MLPRMFVEGACRAQVAVLHNERTSALTYTQEERECEDGLISKCSVQARVGEVNHLSKVSQEGARRSKANEDDDESGAKYASPTKTSVSRLL